MYFLPECVHTALSPPQASSPQQQGQHTGSSVCFITLLPLYQPKPLIYTVRRHPRVTANICDLYTSDQLKITCDREQVECSDVSFFYNFTREEPGDTY